MFKTRFISILALLLMAVSGAWATITVTWNNNDITGSGNSFTKDGVTITAGMIDFNFKNFMMGGTFTTDLGNFTKIEVTAGDVDEVSGTGWSGNWTKKTWTGNASSVSFSGDIMGKGNANFVFTIEPATVAVTGVTLAPTSATLTLGETETVTLIPTVLPGDATDKSVTWSSSNEAVATVTDGVVTAVAAGEATITVTTTDGAKTATCAVTVAAPAASTYTVSLKEGTDDAAKWQGKAGSGEYQALPLEGVAAGTAVTVKYDGRKRVRSVKAVKKAADPLATPLTMEALTDGTIVVNIMDVGGARRYDYIDDFSESRKRAPGRRGSSNISMKYSVNGGEKTTIYEETTIDVNAGDKVQLYGNGPDISNLLIPNISGGTAQVKVYGNIMSMLDEDNYATLTTLPDYAFYALFAGVAGNNTLTDASGLLLPATTLTNYCYNNMFYGCTSLTTAPVLPATTLAEGCYYGMFSGCTSLTTAPVLPATTLAEGCYSGMFAGCTSLTTAPALPATTLADNCYEGMFYGCTSLVTAPALPATTLAGSCYSEMFSGCTSLSSITCLATEGINENSSTSYWVQGVASTGTFTKASGSTWPEGANGIPSGWTVNEQ